MSFTADLFSSISTPELKAKLTIEDRAALLADINDSLEYDLFDLNSTDIEWVEYQRLEKLRSIQLIENYDATGKYFVNEWDE